MELAILLFVLFVGFSIYSILYIIFVIFRVNGELNEQYNRYLITEDLIQRIRSGEDVPWEDFGELLDKNKYNDWQKSGCKPNISLEIQKDYMVERYSYNNTNIEYIKVLAGQAYVDSMLFGSTHEKRKQMGEFYFVPEEEIKKLNENNLELYYGYLDSFRRYATIK